MTGSRFDLLQQGFEAYAQRIRSATDLYHRIVHLPGSDTLLELNGTPYFDSLIEHFGPALKQEEAKVPLSSIYTITLHRPTCSLIVANRGVTLFCRAPYTSAAYITRHLACTVYRPGLGVETVNIGLVGNIYEGSVILRSESACAPSFLFGSQRCNCCYQWASIKELAAFLNPIDPPCCQSGEEFEKWAQQQFIYQNQRHLPFKSGPGLIFMHLDSQSGMGSGHTEKEFCFDLYNRALMRQLGENTTEQLFNISIKEGYEAIGVRPDSRREGNQAGYQITPILLDWLQASRTVICLSNNLYKIGQLEHGGYQVTRVKSLGKIDQAGGREAGQRGSDFNHLDIKEEEISFEEELERLKSLFVTYR